MMILSRRVSVAGLVLLSLCACQRSAPPPAPPQPSAAIIDPHDHLIRLFDRYWEAHLALNPSEASADGDDRFNAHLEDSASVQYLADSLALERTSLEELSSIPSDRLDADQKLSYDLFKADREMAIRGYVFPQELMPFNQLTGMPLRFASMGAGSGAHPFTNTRDYEDWLGRIEEFTTWTTHAIASMRDGMRRGYLMPRVIVQRTLPALSLLSQDRPDNPFYGPLRAFPAAVNAADRARLESRLNAALKTTVFPAYRELYDFLRNEYMPSARTSDGLSALPMGADWYAYCVARETGTAMTPAEVHAFGLAEVERMKTRLQAAIGQVGFAGNLAEFQVFLARDPHFRFAGADELLKAYRDLKPRVVAALPSVVTEVPVQEVEIRALDDYRRTSAGAVLYQSAGPIATRPGILFVDTADIANRATYELPSAFLSEAIPGRHLQTVAQRAKRDLPRFRRFGDLAAFSDGWALYAQGLADELGVNNDPYGRVGGLIDEMRHAVRLVVDTGLHAQGWTRQQALDYWRAQLPMADGDAVAEVERSIALPAQGLGASLGAAKIRAIRAHAQSVLGARFDLRMFHSELLDGGAMPLGLLEARMNRWIRAVQTAPAAPAPLEPASTATP